MRSRPINAETSMNRVERGRWKFVTNASAARKRKPGVMKSDVEPGPADGSPSGATEDSSVRTDVVPTATTRPPAASAASATGQAASAMAVLWPNACQHSYIRRTQPMPRLEQATAAQDISTRQPHIFAGTDSLVNSNGVAFEGAVFLHDYRVGTWRHRRASEDAGRRALLKNLSLTSSNDAL